MVSRRMAHVGISMEGGGRPMKKLAGLLLILMPPSIMGAVILGWESFLFIVVFLACVVLLALCMALGFQLLFDK